MEKNKICKNNLMELMEKVYFTHSQHNDHSPPEVKKKKQVP